MQPRPTLDFVKLHMTYMALVLNRWAQGAEAYVGLENFLILIIFKAQLLLRPLIFHLFTILSLSPPFHSTLRVYLLVALLQIFFVNLLKVN